MDISMVDLGIFTAYILFIVGLGLWVSRDKKGHQKDSNDYFLASNPSLVGNWCFINCCKYFS